MNRYSGCCDGKVITQCTTCTVNLYLVLEYKYNFDACISAPTHRHDTAPLVLKPKPSPSRQNKTEPIVAKEVKTLPGKPSVGSRGQHCVEKGCQRYGDPAQDFRCSQHYAETRRVTPKTSEQSLNLILNAIDPSQRAAFLKGHEPHRMLNGQDPHPGHVAVMGRKNDQHTDKQSGDQFLETFGKLETRMKSKTLCKNNATIGCKNYGNSRTEGYCNTCFTHMKNVAVLRRK